MISTSPGSCCSTSRPAAPAQSSSCLRSIAKNADEASAYHLRLLIDAQLVKEVNRNPAGLPCVRLTNAGHELIGTTTPARHDAMFLARDAAGGQSLTVIRAILTKWAVESATRGDSVPRRYAPVYHRPVYRQPTPRHVQPPASHLADAKPFELVRTRPDYRERFDWRDRYDHMDAYHVNREFNEASVGVSLPVYIV